MSASDPWQPPSWIDFHQITVCSRYEFRLLRYPTKASCHWVFGAIALRIKVELVDITLA